MDRAGQEVRGGDGQSWRIAAVAGCWLQHVSTALDGHLFEEKKPQQQGRSSCCG